MSNPRHLLLRLATLAIALAAIFAPQNASAKSHANPETRVRDFSAALSNTTQAKPDLNPDKHYEKHHSLRQLASGPPLVPKGGVCFVAGTPVAVAGTRKLIEELRVGDRVRTDNEKPVPTKVAKGWQVIELEMPNPDGSDDTVNIVLLRSPEWIRSLRAKVGGRVELRISEMGLEGPASVRSIVSAQTITEGSGRVVTGTFTHLNSFVYKLTLQGGEVIQGTRQHPIYSEDRQAFVRIDKLKVGELLRTSSGTTRVEEILRVPGDYRVYNIEVEDDHVYFVGDSEVLVHNNCVDTARGVSRKLKSSKCWGQCFQHADDLAKALKERGISGSVLTAKPATQSHSVSSLRFGKASGSYADKALGAPGSPHRAVKVGDTVFDNMSPQGIPYADWLDDIGVGLPNGPAVSESIF